MTTIRPLLAVAALAATFCCGAARAGWITYNPALETSPDEQGWSLQDANTSGSSTLHDPGGGAPWELRVNTYDPQVNYHRWVHDFSELDFTVAGYVLEAEFRIADITGTTAHSFFMRAVDENQYTFALFPRKDNIQVAWNAGGSGENRVLDYPAPPQGEYHDFYHTYRLEYVPATATTGTLDLWIDQTLVMDSQPITLAPTTRPTAAVFGTGFSGQGADVYLRSIGFWAVPEPGSAALLMAGALAGLVAFGRRRRR